MTNRQRAEVAAILTSASVPAPTRRPTAHNDSVILARDVRAVDRPVLIDTVTMADRRPRRTIIELREAGARQQSRFIGLIERDRDIRQRAEREAHRRVVDAGLESLATYEAGHGNTTDASHYDGIRRTGNAAVRAGATDVAGAFRAATPTRS